MYLVRNREEKVVLGNNSHLFWFMLLVDYLSR